MERGQELIMIRECDKKDLPDILRLLGELAAALGEKDRATGDKVERIFRQMNVNPEIYRNYVCEFDGRVVAFASVVFYKSFFHEVGTALVNEFIVDDQYRGLAIGTSLMAEIVDEAKQREMDEIEVGLVKGNAKAYEFYKRCGLDEEYVLLGKEFDSKPADR
jgi:GNAT superfamily N-acetyltransferase